MPEDLEKAVAMQETTSRQHGKAKGEGLPWESISGK